MKSFEYKLITIDSSRLKEEAFQIELSEKFNQWGKEGWDLVKMESVNSGGFFRDGATTVGFFTVFKREIF